MSDDQGLRGDHNIDTFEDGTPDPASDATSETLGRRLDRTTAWLLTIGGGIGLLASFQLTLDKIRFLSNPAYKPSCDLNPVLTCGSVITTDQASVFGFPNPILGLSGFAVLVTLGILLMAKVQLPRWVWLGLNAGALGGFAFVQWLAWQSLYDIGALCPWCMVVWAVTVPLFLWVTATNLANGRFAGRSFTGHSSDTAYALAGLRWILLAAWTATLGALIFLRWQDYWLGSLGL